MILISHTHFNPLLQSDYESRLVSKSDKSPSVVRANRHCVCIHESLKLYL